VSAGSLFLSCGLKPLPTPDYLLRSNPPVRAIKLRSEVSSLINPAAVPFNRIVDMDFLFFKYLFTTSLNQRGGE
jgi:hypothetical protein